MALCAACLVYQTEQLLQIPFNKALVVFVFFCTLCSYNFHYLLGSISSAPQNIRTTLSDRFSAVLVMFAGAAGAVFIFSATAVGLPYLLIAFVLTLLYSLPLLPFRLLEPARKAGFVKTLLLAFTWTYVTAIIPIQQYEHAASGIVVLLVCKRFLFMLMLCILFDNRDITVDKIRGLSSLATQLKPVYVRWLLYIIFALLFVLNFMLGKSGITALQVLALQVAAFINLVIYFFSLKKQGYFFYYFVVDGSMVVMTLLTLLASI